jgi:hypothetical protein
VVLCREFLGLLGLLPVSSGIYRVLRSGFLREKCGEIVVNAWLNVETGWLSKTP